MKLTCIEFEGQRVSRLYRDGLKPGCSTGWPSVDRLYTVAAGQLTVITGIPNHGKSAWLDALTVNLLNHDPDGKPWKFLMVSPEQEPLEFHIAELIERRIGKSFRSGSRNRMTEAEVAAAVKEMGRRYEFASFEDGESFFDAVGEAYRFAERCEVNGYRGGVIFDPWNRLEHERPPHLTETEYISDALSRVSQMARETGLHVWIVAHPAKLQPDPQTKRRPVPTGYDIAGSANWANKADNIITVWRDVLAAQGTPEARRTLIAVGKVRWKHVGRLGNAWLEYEPSSGRYVDSDAGPDSYRSASDGE